MADKAEGASAGSSREVVSLSQAAALFLSGLAPEVRQETQGEVYRFARWYGADRPMEELRGHDVALYAESLGAATADVVRRAEALRSFLAFAKKERLTATNLATHLRLRKSPQSTEGAATTPGTPSQLTAEGHTSLSAELKSLKAQRPHIAEDLRRAMADKDFRENAPLDAAREHQAHVEGRIRQLETILKHAEMVGGETAPGARTHLGSTVILRDLASGSAVRYTLVSPSEVSPSEGKISIASPVGKALINRTVGDEVEVSVPVGRRHFRIEEIQG
ncbi:MAG: transcription elongation factor GreA [Dehalococcoidia bacterium]|nr:transcription elongation factor GreA [Dehalococcoidia bacterium]